MKFNRRDLQTIHAAINSAINNEESFIEAHINRFTGKSIDPPVTRRTIGFIRRMRTLQNKIRGYEKEPAK